METEENNEIPFLDILIKRTEEGNIETKIFRKKTHTDRYLNFNSFHHKSQKISVIDSLVHRAFQICSPIHLTEELNHIKKVLTQNAFPIDFINKRIERMKSKFSLQTNPDTTTNLPTLNCTQISNGLTTDPIQTSLNINNHPSNIESEKEDFWVPLPYIGNISNKVGGYLRRKLKWKVTFTPGKKILNMLPSLKDKEEINQAGIYSIPCETCTDAYLGESMRFEERKEDHKGNVRRREYNKSAIARHIIRNKQHKINWEDGKIIFKEKDFALRKIKEGLAIQQSTKQLMNTDKGLILSNAWKPIIPNIYDFLKQPDPNL